MRNVKNYVVTYIPAEGSDYELPSELKRELERIVSLVILTSLLNKQPKIIVSFQEELEDKVLEIKGVVRIKEDYHYNPQ